MEARVALGLALGLLPGSVLIITGAPELSSGSRVATGLIASAGVGLFILAVAMGTCLAPARRALQVHPTGAMRADG